MSLRDFLGLNFKYNRNPTSNSSSPLLTAMNRGTTTYDQNTMMPIREPSQLWAITDDKGTFTPMEQVGNPSAHEIAYYKDESGTMHPTRNPNMATGLQSLLPTGPIDLAAETILSGISQDNPQLGIALGLLGARYAPQIAKGVDVHAGSVLSKRQYKKGFKKAKSDPMQKEVPFEGESQFIPRKFAGDFVGAYNPLAGSDLIRHGASLGDVGKPFLFQKFALTDMLREPALKKKALQRTVYHEGRHHLQHKAGSPPNAPETLQYKTFEGVVQKPKNYARDESNILETLGEKGVKQYKARQEYLGSPHEVEARLEEITSFGVKNTPLEIRELKEVGYTNKQIDTMLKAYAKARRSSFGIPRQGSSGRMY